MKTIVRTLGVYFAAGLAMQMGMDFAKRVHLDVDGTKHITSFKKSRRGSFIFYQKERV